MIRVLMYPNLSNFDKYESGIKRVVEAYYKYAPKYGIQYVEEGEDYDVQAVHAGMYTKHDGAHPLVSHCHGLYWTADYPASAWEWRANANVVWSLTYATAVTVPSDWVAETIRRDMRIKPIVVPHGIEAGRWHHNLPVKGHVLWNKNRNADVCDPAPMATLAKLAPEHSFISTFKPESAPANVHEIGMIPHAKMKELIQTAGVYLSTTKETFGIGILEALASGTPVLSINAGGGKQLVRHCINGYLYNPASQEDMIQGLRYCFQHRDALSHNAKITAQEWTWNKAMEKVAYAYSEAVRMHEAVQRPMQIDEGLYKIDGNFAE